MNWRFLVKKKKKKDCTVPCLKATMFIQYIWVMSIKLYSDLSKRRFSRNVLSQKKKSKTYYAYSESISLL